MRTVTALDVRRRFGQIIDQAAAGERIVIERAGQPVAALVPLADLARVDPDRRRAAPSSRGYGTRLGGSRVTFSLGQPAVVIDASAALALLAGDESWLARWRGWTEADTMILA